MIDYIVKILNGNWQEQVSLRTQFFDQNGICSNLLTSFKLFADDTSLFSVVNDASKTFKKSKKWFVYCQWEVLCIFIESPSMTVIGSFFLSGVSLLVFSLEFCKFWVAVLIAFCFAVISVLGESVLVFSFSVGLSSVSSDK